MKKADSGMKNMSKPYVCFYFFCGWYLVWVNTSSLLMK